MDKGYDGSINYWSLKHFNVNPGTKRKEIQRRTGQLFVDKPVSYSKAPGLRSATINRVRKITRLKYLILIGMVAAQFVYCKKKKNNYTRIEVFGRISIRLGVYTFYKRSTLLIRTLKYLQPPAPTTTFRSFV